MAFTSIADVYTLTGTISAPTDLPRDVAMAVKKLKRREIGETDLETGEQRVVGHTVELEMVDKVAPLRLLGLELGMFSKKVEHTADDALLVALREGRERALAAI
jgi:hypothetical protein